MPAELIIVPESGRFDMDDSRWKAQTALLYQDLRRHVDGFERRLVPVPGTKGAVETIAVLLGAGGGMAALATCFRAWLERDKSRSIRISVTDGDGRETTWTFDGDTVDRASLQAALAGSATALSGADAGDAVDESSK